MGVPPSYPGAVPVYPSLAPVPYAPTGAAPVWFGPKKTNGLAIGSFIGGLFGMNVVAIVLGSIAISQINKSGGREGGKGLAIAGIVLSVLWIVGLIVVFIVLASSSPDQTYYY